MNIKDITLISLMAALMCIVAPFSLPVGPIPISLSTFAVYIAAGLLGRKRGTMAVLTYILLGATGLPVFSGFSGGIQKLFGVTGGYIIGYLPCVYISGYFIKNVDEKKWVYPIGLSLGTLACYTLGTLWFMLQASVTPLTALSTCVFPFIPGDIIKIIAATTIISPMRKVLKLSINI
ncbi:biotin transporter BioY [Alloiococcus sp. CFN-8]|uniref:biotin transporter BioY n=1 Tax=Alloiococcus sp. CFN-8 TaxID=3416081 RepID=UPI003CF94D68